MRNIISKNINLLKITIIGLFALLCVLYNKNNVLAQEKQSEISILSLAESQEYNENELIELVQQMGEELKIENVQDFVIGTEVDCFNLDTQEIIKYLPILHKKECVFVAVIEQNGKLSISNDTKFYQKLLDSYDHSETYLLYIEGNNVYAIDNNNETFLLETFSDEKRVSKFHHEYKFTEKVRYIKKKFACKLKKAVSGENNIRLSDIKNRNSVLDNNKTKNIVSLASTSASQAKSNVCPIKKFVKQIDNTCWAATVATIVNYKKNKNITDVDVCNKMGIPISEGGNLYETQAAFKSYKLSYHIKASYLIWSSICKNIDDDKPFCMALETKAKDAHIVTGYGYKSTSTGSKKISVWDSNGYKRIVEYKADKTAITINGKSFVWLASLY